MITSGLVVELKKVNTFYTITERAIRAVAHPKIFSPFGFIGMKFRDFWPKNENFNEIRLQILKFFAPPFRLDNLIPVSTLKYSIAFQSFSYYRVHSTLIWKRPSLKS
jgi:hypothetical protein